MKIEIKTGFEVRWIVICLVKFVEAVPGEEITSLSFMIEKFSLATKCTNSD